MSTSDSFDSQNLHTLDLLHLIHHIAHGFPWPAYSFNFSFSDCSALISSCICFDLRCPGLPAWIFAACSCLHEAPSPSLHSNAISPVGSQCLDTAYACCDAGLGDDLKAADIRRIRYMGTAAKLRGEISHGYHTDRIAVLFAEQRHGARSSSPHPGS